MHAHGRGLDLGSHPAILRFLFRREAGPRRQRETSASGPLLCTALGMAGVGSLVRRRWVRELVLGSEALSSPRAGQLLKVLQEAEAPGPSSAAGKSDVGASLLVSDGTHSIRCLVTREALNASDWEEKEFGFRGAEGRLLLLQDCEVRVQVAEGGAPAEFYLQVDRFSLLPTEQPREQVTGCNQDPDVREKLYDCLDTPSHPLDRLTLQGHGPIADPDLLSSFLTHFLSPHQAHVTRAQKPSLEFKELGLTPETWQHSPRTRATKGALESSPVWDPPKRHRDGSAFQYEYEPPCPSVCAQIQAARLPPQLVAWALHFLMEPQLDSELTQV
ncbi:adrenocortical dysplasia protein-like protein [Camelus ferus]|nr:adrenocortical dysplasia protein-like protein [Camelus ferus]